MGDQSDGRQLLIDCCRDGCVNIAITIHTRILHAHSLKLLNQYGGQILLLFAARKAICFWHRLCIHLDIS